MLVSIPSVYAEASVLEDLGGPYWLSLFFTGTFEGEKITVVLTGFPSPSPSSPSSPSSFTAGAAAFTYTNWYVMTRATPARLRIVPDVTGNIAETTTATATTAYAYTFELTFPKTRANPFSKVVEFEVVVDNDNVVSNKYKMKNTNWALLFDNDEFTFRSKRIC